MTTQSTVTARFVRTDRARSPACYGMWDRLILRASRPRLPTGQKTTSRSGQVFVWLPAQGPAVQRPDCDPTRSSPSICGCATPRKGPSPRLQLGAGQYPFAVQSDRRKHRRRLAPFLADSGRKTRHWITDHSGEKSRRRLALRRISDDRSETPIHVVLEIRLNRAGDATKHTSIPRMPVAKDDQCL